MTQWFNEGLTSLGKEIGKHSAVVLITGAITGAGGALGFWWFQHGCPPAVVDKVSTGEGYLSSNRYPDAIGTATQAILSESECACAFELRAAAEAGELRYPQAGYGSPADIRTSCWTDVVRAERLGDNSARLRNTKTFCSYPATLSATAVQAT